MNLATTMWLAIAMGLLAIFNASLMAWLWRFPLTPEGEPTAPKTWRLVHRGVGYTFIAVYVALLTQMVPRAWEYREGNSLSVIHGALGTLVGVVLTAKILVIRRFHALGGKLPWFGGTLLVVTLATVGLAVPPAWRVHSPLTAPPASGAERWLAGRDVVASHCVQCHGASVIVGEDDDWDKITRQMMRYSQRMPGKREISESERVLAASYLRSVLGEKGEGREEERDEEDGRRRRRRGRDDRARD